MSFQQSAKHAAVQLNREVSFLKNVFCFTAVGFY